MRDTGTRDSVLVELDFGATPGVSLTSVISDPRVSVASSILMVQSGAAPTGKSADENEMDAFVCRCLPGAGSFTAYIDSAFGPVRDKFKFNYVVR